MSVNTIEGNTSSQKGLIANGGCVAEKSYSNTYNRIAIILRPKYKNDEAYKVISTAKKYRGYLEKKSNSLLESFTSNAGANNYNMFAPHAKSATGSSIYQNGVAWCDIFVDDMFIRALGASRAKQLLGGWSAYTPSSAELLRRAGAKSVPPSEATFGDVIFFKNSTRICHTGLVTNGYNIEPATNDNYKYSQNDFIKEVCGYLGVKDAQSAFSKTVTLSATKNPKHTLVLYVQKRLKDLGYYKGVPDRDFGPLTTDAVNQYQSKVLRYKNTDGEITKRGNMWRSLLGIQ